MLQLALLRFDLTGLLSNLIDWAQQDKVADYECVFMAMSECSSVLCSSLLSRGMFQAISASIHH